MFTLAWSFPSLRLGVLLISTGIGICVVCASSTSPLRRGVPAGANPHSSVHFPPLVLLSLSSAVRSLNTLPDRARYAQAGYPLHDAPSRSTLPYPHTTPALATPSMSAPCLAARGGFCLGVLAPLPFSGFAPCAPSESPAFPDLRALWRLLLVGARKRRMRMRAGKMVGWCIGANDLAARPGGRDTLAPPPVLASLLNAGDGSRPHLSPSAQRDPISRPQPHRHHRLPPILKA
ncbi:hypothetical protein B0H14DRAFT_3442228 [Mycena olivaceomarginata]|nr:hypothetical protein B0H14DRAFT_3442228 [Mycena olivaceomarginata]